MHCQINIGWMGEKFIEKLATINNETIENNNNILNEIFSMCFRFLLELYLSNRGEQSPELHRARKFAFDNIDNFDETIKNQIWHSINEMPINILKSLFDNNLIKSIRDLQNTTENVNKLKTQWDKEINEKEERVNALRNDIEKYESAFNFVGLHQGFDDLSKIKKEEIERLSFWLRLIGGAILLPIIVELIILYTNMKNIGEIKDFLLLSIVPTISLMAISIYYFKIILFNYKSVKSQILQIELRKTLCRFIQSYTKYSSEINAKSPDSLSKFENIIFSSIVSDDEKLPSAYDGIDQISKLIMSAKGK